MGAAQHNIRRSDDDAQPRSFCRAPGFHRDREFRQGHPEADRFIDMPLARVVMAGKRHAQLFAQRHKACAVLLLRLRALSGGCGNFGLNSIRRRAFAEFVATIAVGIAIWAVIHRSDKPQGLVIQMGRQLRHQLNFAQIAAQVEKMVGLKQAGRAGRIDAVQHMGQNGEPVRIAHRTDDEAVEHSGRAAQADDHVVGSCRIHRIPKDTTARHGLLFQVIGMHVHKPGQKKITLKVHIRGA